MGAFFGLLKIQIFCGVLEIPDIFFFWWTVDAGPESTYEEKWGNREEEPHNNHDTSGRQTKQSNQLSLFHVNMIAKLALNTK